MHDESWCKLKASACLCVWGLALSLPVWADEIVTITDENGRKIFINTGDTRASGKGAESVSSPAKAVNGTLRASEINRMVEQTASRLQVDPQLVQAIIKVESEYDPKALSNKGAMGLMQLIPETAQRFGVENPFNPKENIEGGVSYLRHLLDLFGGDLPLSLAAYNAGEGAVQRSGGIPSFAETRNYVRKVTDIYQGPSQSGYKPQAPRIIRYVDERGVVHYTNVE